MENKPTFMVKDFIPSLISNKNYESLDMLVEKLNLWLKLCNDYDVKNCETFNVRIQKTNSTDPEKMTYHRTQCNSNDGPYYQNKYLRCLRVWLIRNDNKTDHQSVNMRTYHPSIMKSSHGTQVWSLYELLKNVNDDLTNNPIKGRIVNVETKPIQMANKEIDSNCGKWKEAGNCDIVNVFVIRIFFVLMSDHVLEQIHFEDFPPKIPVTEKGEIDFSNLKNTPQLRESLKSNQHLDFLRNGNGRIINIQTLDVKMKVPSFAENREILKYKEHCDLSTYYWRIIRIVIGIPIHGLSSPSAFPPITYKAFLPVLLTSDQTFENMTDTMLRINPWLNIVSKQHDLRIIGFETFPMRYKKGAEKHFGSEASWTVNKTGRRENWVYVIKIYFFGSFLEPSPNELPIVPPVLIKGSCALS